MTTRLIVATAAIAATAAVMALRYTGLTAEQRPGGRPSPTNVSNEWVSIGPTPLSFELNRGNLQSGRVSSVAVDPADSTHWLLGVGDGGVWQSHDSGASWVSVTDSAPTLATGAIAFAPSDPSVVYVGTGESAGVSFAKVGLGLLKSTDGGDGWSLLAASSFARGHR